MNVNTIPFFPDLDLDKVVQNIGQDGYSMGIKLTEEYVDAIAKYYGDKKGRIHWDPHKTHKTIFDISHNSKIIDIVRKYLGVEPILHSSVLIWSSPRFDNRRNPSPFSHQHFHYEVGDIRSLKVFIYLTDTDRDCGPHVVITNTHRYKTPLQFIKHTLTDNEAHEKYGDRVRVITGGKGTGFFEDSTAFHKQLINKKPRLILNLVYHMRRKPSLEQRFRSRSIRTQMMTGILLQQA